MYISLVKLKRKLVKFTNIFRALLTSQYSLMHEYRAEIALWAISGLLPLIMLGIWTQSSFANFNGSNYNFFVKYFISAFIVRQFTAVWVIISFEEDNLEGRLSPFLLQPISPFWRYFSSHIAEQLTRIPFVFFILIIIFLGIQDSFWIPPFHTILLSPIAIFLAFVIRFLLHWIFAMCCFFNDKASSLERLLLIPYLFLSGLVAPLETYPEILRTAAYFTPFPYLISFPSLLLSGSIVNPLNYFMHQLIWIFILSIFSFCAWRLGVRHYSAMGA